MRHFVPAILLAAAAAASAQTAPDADQLALRKLKDDITSAVTKRDFDSTDKLLHHPFSATLITQANFHDIAGLKNYYQTVFTESTPRLKDMAISAQVDGPSLILTGTFAVNRGATDERYVLADGRAFDMKGRWTSVSLKQPDGAWKLVAVHTGVNFMDNAVLAAIERSAAWSGGIGLALGLVLGIAGGWGFRKFFPGRRPTA